MIKLFFYELRRLLLNKFFIGLLFIAGFFSYYVLSGEVILGVGYTAPFSGWSYGWFLSQILPLLMIALLFLVSFLFTKQEKQVQTIIAATPVNPAAYLLTRCLAMLTGLAVITAVIIAESLIFYKILFRFTSFGDFLMPVIVTIIPATLLTLGTGLIAGRLNLNVLYCLMLLLLFVNPMHIDIFGSNFYSSYPASLTVNDPPFILPVSFLTGRVIFAAAGIILTAAGIILYTKNGQKS